MKTMDWQAQGYCSILPIHSTCRTNQGVATVQIRGSEVRIMADIQKRVEELRLTLMGDLSQQELENMQLKVDTLLKLAIMDAGHDHDTQGGVGHHDHKA